MDLDIDAVTLLGSEFDNNGKYVMWSPLADISSIGNLEASLTLPFPTGKGTEIVIDNKKESFFNKYNDYLYELFEVDTTIVKDNNGIYERRILTNELGLPILKLKEQTPERIKLLAKFLELVEKDGLTIKGDTTSDGKWKPSEELLKEWEDRNYLDETRYQETTNALKELGFTTPAAAYNALQQIKRIVDKHNMYTHTAGKRVREMMTKNQCQWAMYLVCSTASNLTELMTGVDVATDPIKNKKTGAVALSPYNGADKHTSPGSYYTIFRSFQEGLIGKQCVGIGAVSIKVNSTTQFYMDTVLNEGTDAEKARLLFPKVDSWGKRDSKNGKRGYLIGGKLRKGLFNLYDKSSETIPEELTILKSDGTFVTLKANQPEEILELLADNQIPEDLTPNVAMSLAAMLSVAVDFLQY